MSNLKHTATLGYAAWVLFCSCFALSASSKALMPVPALQIVRAEIQDDDTWKFIKANGYKLPPGKSAAELSRTLSKLLGSADPQLRDETAFDILANWIYRNRLLSDDDLRPLILEWTANLTKDIGSVGSDAVALRSFSALTLSIVVARDNATPFLTEQEFRKILESALKYADQERDLRGYDPVKGWLHATAHTADLLKFLARSRYLGPADQKAILNAVAHKLTTANLVFSFGEDERLARTVLSVVARKDFAAFEFAEWVNHMRPAPAATSQPDISVLRADQNVLNMLAKLYFLLKTTDGVAWAGAAADMVQKGLDGTF